MADHSQMKLGRKAIKTDTRTLAFGDYLTPSLPPPPATADWTKGIASWGMMLNDTLGDCTIAGVAHAVQVWTANAGTEVTVPDPTGDTCVVARYCIWKLAVYVAAVDAVKVRGLFAFPSFQDANTACVPVPRLTGELKPRQKVRVRATREDGSVVEFTAIARLDTPVDVDYYKNGGILQSVLRGLAME